MPQDRLLESDVELACKEFCHASCDKSACVRSGRCAEDGWHVYVAPMRRVLAAVVHEMRHREVA